jgi:hypothetical protein
MIAVRDLSTLQRQQLAAMMELYRALAPRGRSHAEGIDDSRSDRPGRTTGRLTGAVA